MNNICIRIFLTIQCCTVSLYATVVEENKAAKPEKPNLGAKGKVAGIGGGMVGGMIGSAAGGGVIKMLNGGSTPKPPPTCVPKVCITDDPPPEPLCSPFITRNMTSKQKLVKTIASTANCALLGVALALGDIVGVVLGILRILGFPIPKVMDLAGDVFGAAKACHINGTPPQAPPPPSGKRRRSTFDLFDVQQAAFDSLDLLNLAEANQDTEFDRIIERQERGLFHKLKFKIKNAVEAVKNTSKAMGHGVAKAAKATVNATKAAKEGAKNFSKVVANVTANRKQIFECMKAKAALQAKGAKAMFHVKNFTKMIVQATKKLGRETMNSFKLYRKSMNPLKALGSSMRDVCGKLGTASGIFKRSIQEPSLMQHIHNDDSSLAPSSIPDSGNSGVDHEDGIGKPLSIIKRNILASLTKTAATSGDDVAKVGASNADLAAEAGKAAATGAGKSALSTMGAGQGNLTICGEDGTTEPPKHPH